MAQVAVYLVFYGPLASKEKLMPPSLDLTASQGSNAGYGERRMTKVRSEIAGTVWKIEVDVGASVAAGDVLLILESMKMEIPVEAPSAGVVEAIEVAEGQAVKEGQPLLTLA